MKATSRDNISGDKSPKSSVAPIKMSKMTKFMSVLPKEQESKMSIKTPTRQNTMNAGDNSILTEREFTPDWSDETKPMFISEFPFDQGLTVFDCYFNMENSSWFKFDMAKVTSRMLL